MKKLSLNFYQIKALFSLLLQKRGPPQAKHSQKTSPSFLTEKLTAHLRCYLGSDFGCLRDESYVECR